MYEQENRNLCGVRYSRCLQASTGEHGEHMAWIRRDSSSYPFSNPSYLYNYRALSSFLSQTDSIADTLYSCEFNRPGFCYSLNNTLLYNLSFI